MTTRSHQHVVPKLLLRHFAIDDKVEMRTRQRLCKPVSIVDAGVQKHFYSFVDASGHQLDDLERHLADHVESPAARAIEAALAGRSYDQGAVFKLVAFQLARSPRFRHLDEHFGDQIGPLLAGFDAVTAASEASPQLEAAELQRVFTESVANPPAQYLRRPSRNARIRILIRTAEQLAEAMQRLTWAIAESARPWLCVSDSPAVLFDPTLAEAQFGGFSIRSTVEVQMPLSPRHLLLGTLNRLGDDHIPLTSELARSVNERLARECRYAIFVTPGIEPLGALVLSPNPPPLPTPTVTIRRKPGTEPTDTTLPAIADADLRQLVAATELDTSD